MGCAIYNVVPHGDGWGIDHDGHVTGSYATKEAAFEVAAAAASNAIKEGHEVHVTVAGRDAAHKSALGA
jgi:hypothetical protein